MPAIMRPPPFASPPHQQPTAPSLFLLNAASATLVLLPSKACIRQTKGFLQNDARKRWRAGDPSFSCEKGMQWIRPGSEKKRGRNMGRFLNGVLIGVGIGLLVAPMKGEEMRRLVSERYGMVRSNLPDNEQLKQAGQQVAAGAAQTAGQLKGYAQQAASQVKATGSSLGDLAQQATRDVKQTGQDVAGATKKAATSLKPGGQKSTTTAEEETEKQIVFI